MLHAQMYHTKPIDDRELCIKGDPYEHELVKQLLIAMGVIFYRDENHSYNALNTKCEPNIDAYYSQVVFNENTWTIDKWSSVKMEKSGKTFKDAFVWLAQNTPVKIQSMTKTSVTLLES